VKRREFITLLGGATAAWPVAARAQQGDRMRRVGVLIGFSENDSEAQTRVAAFRQAFHGLGWVEDRNVRIDYRWAGGNAERLRVFAAELLALTPDVIFTTNTLALAVLQKATRSVPIVFVQVTDPVGGRFVASLARPGGNITGFTSFEYAIVGNWLELLKEIAPTVKRVMVMQNPESIGSTGQLHAIETMAPLFGVQLTPVGVRGAQDIEQALATLAREPDGGLVVLPDLVTVGNGGLIADLATRHRLVAVYPLRFFAAKGGLISYGNDTVDLYRRAASYVDRVLKGEKPADLPVQAPIKFELVINLKAARALGLDEPPTLLARADEVIE
jgi:putative ABC transport system substrate-binding protein